MGQLDFDHGWNTVDKSDYRTDDPPTYKQACMGMMVCPHCGRAVICGDTVTEHEFQTTGEQDDMIPRGNQQDDGGNRGSRKRKGSGLRYLSADMLSVTHQLADIIDARVQPDNFGKDRPDVVVVKLRLKGEYLLWTLRSNNPSLNTLGDAFGDDETTWKGHQVELYLEEDQFDGKKWIRCDAVATSTPTTKRGK